MVLSIPLIDDHVILFGNEEKLTMQIFKEFPFIVPANDIILDFDPIKHYNDLAVYDAYLNKLDYKFI